MAKLFGKRSGEGSGRGSLGRGVDDAEHMDGLDEGVPASEAIVDADPSAPTDEDPAFRADVDEAMRATTGKRSFRDRFSGVRFGKSRRPVEDGDAVVLGDDDEVSEVSNEGVRKKPFGGKLFGSKAAKAERAAHASAATDKRLSNMVMIDFYPGLTKDDAIETARHWAMTHMDVPSLCYYYIHKIRDGFAVEVQEGVGKAYLPSVIELATENPGRIIVVPMVRRKLTVFYSARLGEFEAQILPELQDPPSMPENPPIQAARSTSMTPVLKQYMEWLYAGVGTAAVGGLALLTSLIFYAVDPKSKVPPEWHTTEVSQLPVMQWNRLNPDATDSYVVRLEYQDGQWRIVRQSTTGSTVDIAPATPGTPDASIQGAGPDAGGIPAPAGGQVPGGQDAGQQGAPTNIPPPADNGGQ